MESPPPLQVLDKLDAHSVLLVKDWAMKFLPRKFRESQSDWFATRGIHWHITVAIRRVPELQMMKFVNLFPSRAQDSAAVLAIIDDRRTHPFEGSYVCTAQSVLQAR